ncbi:MAG: double-stranded DNA-binding protein [Candidatus Nitrosotenuis sp.]|nr:double-stranded DNA-binding protein [Candidatus Nitrosotenuis sp.]
MSEEDRELEMLKAKRLAEMQKNISSQAKPQTSTEPKKTQSYREVLVQRLGYRGMEVLQNAEYQFPNETKMVVDKLGELMQSGELTEEIDGGKLLALFRSVDINVRMETKINVEQDGKFVSLSDKLTSKSESDESHD